MKAKRELGNSLWVYSIRELLFLFFGFLNIFKMEEFLVCLNIGRKIKGKLKFWVVGEGGRGF